MASSSSARPSSLRPREAERGGWPYPALVPHSLKMYPVVQLAPEVAPPEASSWPPPMKAGLVRWRAGLSHLPSSGNQLYVHVPFCPFICHFCPLYKVTDNAQRTPERKERYVRSLLHEIELYSRSPAVAGQTFQSVYLGGGTPSELTPEQLGRILAALRSSFDVAPDAEITLEGVARQIAAGDYLARCVELGFNRISFGVQTLDVELRKRIGRGDRVTDYPALIAAARRQFPELNVNFEIMIGMPEQTVSSLSDDLDQILGWGPDSVDLLYYVHMPGTKLVRLAKERGSAPAAGEALLEARQLIHRTMSTHGFTALTGEVFTKSDRDLFTRTSFGGGGHGLNTLLALGPSAFGLVHGTAYHNVADLDAYEACLRNDRLPVKRAARLSASAARRRAWALSTLQLFLYDELVQTSADHARIRRWEDLGLVRREAGGYRLTFRGQLWYNHMQLDALPLGDQLKALRMFGSLEEHAELLRGDEKALHGYWPELRALIGRGGPCSALRLSTYGWYLRMHQMLSWDRRAVGFTGPIS